MVTKSINDTVAATYEVVHSGDTDYYYFRAASPDGKTVVTGELRQNVFEATEDLATYLVGPICGHIHE